MSAKNPAGDDKSAATVVADDSEDALDTPKRIGGSQSDDWNHVLGDQALQSLWIMHSDKEVRERQFLATIAGLIGIAPQDEIESMIAAQLIAAHNATMECYRRAMIGEQTLEGRRDNLSEPVEPIRCSCQLRQDRPARVLDRRGRTLSQPDGTRQSRAPLRPDDRQPSRLRGARTVGDHAQRHPHPGLPGRA